jgi:hypothetical protein
LKTQLLDQPLAEAALVERPHQNLQARRITEFRRDHGAVEIGAKSDAILA